MIKFLSILAIAAAIAFGGTAVQSWTSDGAYAQDSSACYQRCRDQYNWPREQCRKYCRGKT